MNTTAAKSGLKYLGTITALSCILLFHRAYFLASIREWPGFILVLALGFYFAYVGFLTWFRFSPLAIRHICGGTLFWVFLLIGSTIIKVVTGIGVVRGALSILLLAALVWVYRKAWHYFSNLIFNEPERPAA